MKDTNGIALIIMDGWGDREPAPDNAITAANKPNFDNLWANYPHGLLKADGEWVGLPEGQMGTSEVNHLTIGSGRVLYQDLVRINKDIREGTFFTNEVLLNAMKEAKEAGSKLHLKALISDGGVHSHIEHVKALLKMAKDQGVSRVYVHAFTDGRDTLPKSGLGYIGELEKYMAEIGVGKIASIVGRYFAMDRDQNWERTNAACDALVAGIGRVYPGATEMIQTSYDEGLTDEFIEPGIIDMGEENARIQNGDVVIFANFRMDRPRQMVKCFEDMNLDIHYVTMTQYSPSFGVKVAYPPILPLNTLGEVLSRNKLKQLRVTETEKFAHLTYFLNGKQEDKFEAEDRIMLDSYSDIKTHDERPQMRADDITREVVQAIEDKTHDVIFANICNADMVGHTGNFDAIVKGIETTDKALGEIVKAAEANNFEVIITADHGNAEETIDQASGQPMTSHTLNPVPVILVSHRFKALTKDAGSLIDLAPTILKMADLPVPSEMDGESLV